MIALQSAVRFRALPLTRYEWEPSQNCWPLACPHIPDLLSMPSVPSVYLWRGARDFAYQALPLFCVQHWKGGSGLGTRLISIHRIDSGELSDKRRTVVLAIAISTALTFFQNQAVIFPDTLTLHGGKLRESSFLLFQPFSYTFFCFTPWHATC